MSVRTSEHDVETFPAGGNTFRIIDDGATTDGRIGIVECLLDPGWAGPPQHVHRDHDETFFVMRGEVRFTSGRDSFVVGPGRLVTVPKGDPHTFGNASSDAPASLLCTVTPARYVEFFRELATLTPGADGRLDRHELIGLMHRYATEPSAA
jgi:mannose-6-phosphate isomerase-like protein (cupin superfamily)